MRPGPASETRPPPSPPPLPPPTFSCCSTSHHHQHPSTSIYYPRHHCYLFRLVVVATVFALTILSATATVNSVTKSPPYKKNLTVGYLTAIKGELKERQGLAVSGALTYALDEVNNDPNLLPHVNLVLKWNDTRGDVVVATRAMTEMICEGVAVFFGPEGTCYVEAIVAQSRNIPMISYKCSDYKASNVPTFARTEPPDTQVTKSIIALLRYYGWNKFSVFHEQSWETVANSLRDQAKAKNMTINGMQIVMDSHKCCEKKLDCCQSGYWYKTIQDTKNKTRIYVFLGTPMTLIDMMNTMHTAQLFDNGEYMVIYVDMNTYSEKEAQKYLWRPEDMDKSESCDKQQRDFEKRAKSLLVVVSTPPMENYENFTKKVSEYNAKDPFNFTIPPILHNFTKFVSIYAAYLYDSVILYAQALHELLKNQQITDELIAEISSNGTKIIETIIRMGQYKSITGTQMHVDKNGDSEGNFSVLALQKKEFRVNNFSCTYQMVPVGYFLQGENLEYKLKNPNTPIEWPGGIKPEDEPSCGFDNRSCPKDDNHKSKIASGILGILLFCAIVITASIYRKWKIEQEIEGLLWKIDPQEIHNYFGNDIISSPSKLSLASASVTSYESRCGAQVFAATGYYRGVVVRIKELKFSKKKDISRDVMKEMRLLRDIRHDNINSFIGACVEPMRILLVTDYCAKGSLYDIIENEDIKLDNMFIASLVHDLIRGMLYIHNSMLVFHGNLKSSNCVVTSRWILQITDFGLLEMRHCAENDSIGEHQYYRNLFWKAPELLRDTNSPIVKGSQKADVYAFAIILYEIIGRKGPFGPTGREPKEIVDLVKRLPLDGDEPFRPDLDSLLDAKPGCEEFVINCMKDCWTEVPEIRPDFAQIRTRLKKMKDGKHQNIMDQLMEMMVKYADDLEDLVSERTRLLIEEKMKTEDLLHRMLPEPVAKRLTRGHGIEPESFDLVTIYFSDIVGFTAMSAESTPLQVVNFLNDLYTVFDQIIKGYDVYKVETIGDAYMVVSGLPIRNGDKHAGEIASMALDLLSAVKKHTIAHRPNETLKLRIGIHTGPVVAGVVGLTMPRYCLFGDTVNTASRMESNGEALKIHISQQCKEALDKLAGYIIDERGLVYMKGKGQVQTYWLTGATDKAIQRREVDLGQLPPLFCRPRRSPKLNTESRQASICGALGGFGGIAGSRRHSSVPRGTSQDVESTSTLHNSSPLPTTRNYHMNRRMERLHPHVSDLDCCSRHSLNTCAFGSDISDTTFFDERKPNKRTRTVLSSIASSSADEHRDCIKSQSTLNKIRESRSMDLLIPSNTCSDGRDSSGSSNGSSSSGGGGGAGGGGSGSSSSGGCGGGGGGGDDDDDDDDDGVIIVADGDSNGGGGSRVGSDDCSNRDNSKLKQINCQSALQLPRRSSSLENCNKYRNNKTSSNSSSSTSNSNSNNSKRKLSSKQLLQSSVPLTVVENLLTNNNNNSNFPNGTILSDDVNAKNKNDKNDDDDDDNIIYRNSSRSRSSSNSNSSSDGGDDVGDVGSGGVITTDVDNISVGGGCEDVDVEVPLLRTPSLCDNITILHRRRPYITGNNDEYNTKSSSTAKRWRSLEIVPATATTTICTTSSDIASAGTATAAAAATITTTTTTTTTTATDTATTTTTVAGRCSNDSYGGCGDDGVGIISDDQMIDSAQSKKQIARNSLKSWFMGLINGNGLRASNASLRKGVLHGYNDLQAENESIV